MGLWPSGIRRARQSPGELLRGEPSPHPALGPVPRASLKSAECAGEGVVVADEDGAPIQPSLPFQGGSQLRAWLQTHTLQTPAAALGRPSLDSSGAGRLAILLHPTSPEPALLPSANAGGPWDRPG